MIKVGELSVLFYAGTLLRFIRSYLIKFSMKNL